MSSIDELLIELDEACNENNEVFAADIGAKLRFYVSQYNSRSIKRSQNAKNTQSCESKLKEYVNTKKMQLSSKDAGKKNLTKSEKIALRRATLYAIDALLCSKNQVKLLSLKNTLLSKNLHDATNEALPEETAKILGHFLYVLKDQNAGSGSGTDIFKDVYSIANQLKRNNQKASLIYLKEMILQMPDSFFKQMIQINIEPCKVYKNFIFVIKNLLIYFYSRNR